MLNHKITFKKVKLQGERKKFRFTLNKIALFSLIGIFILIYVAITFFSDNAATIEKTISERRILENPTAKAEIRFAIEVANASHLSLEKNFISDLTNEIKYLDNSWSSEISDGEYLRISFEQPLTSDRDIKIFLRIVSGNPKIEVYEKNSDFVIATFDHLVSNDYNRVFLSELGGSQDTFDLRVVSGSIEFDHIVDPPSTEAIKTVEYRLGSYNTGTTTLISSGSTWVATTGQTIILPENNVSVKSAFILVNGYTGSAAAITAIKVGFANKTYNPVTGTYISAYPAQGSYWALANVTDAFASFNNPMTADANLTVTGPTSGGMGMKLIITYTYNDSTSTELLNTIKYPITSNTETITTGTYNVTYNASIAEATINNVTNAWFEIQGFDDGINKNDAKISARVVGDSLSPSMHLETGGQDPYDFMFLFNASGTSFDINTEQTLSMDGSGGGGTAMRGLGAELVVTYNYSSSSPRRTKTVSYFMGQGTSRDLTTINTFSRNISLPESNIDVKAIWMKIRGGFESTTAGTTTINGSIDGNSAASKAYNFDTQVASTGALQPLLYDMSSLNDSLDDGQGEVSVSYKFSQALNTPPGIDLYVTYEYDSSSTNQLKTVRYFGGQSAAATTSNSFSTYTWVPEADAQLTNGYIETYSADADTTDPTQTTTIDSSSSSAVQVESATVVSVKTLNGDANNKLSASTTNHTLDLTSATNVGGNSILYLTYNYTAAPAADSCTCTDGASWTIINGDQCTLSTTCNLGANRFRIMNGALRITSTGSLNAQGCYIQNTESLYIINGGKLICRP